jgi:pyruvate dehydrogenase E2 component (dihydrolipoamide acetyltransferase)
MDQKVGDKVSSGDILAEVETDKATMELEAYEDGYLLYIGPDEGDSVPVDDVIAVVGEKGADYQKLLESRKSGKEADTIERENRQSEAVVLRKEPSEPEVQPLSRKKMEMDV